jgi:hypothetical protein
MASLSAGEVFVNLVIKGDGIKPTLAAASAKVKEFGKGISAISVATGTLIAQGVTKALGSVASIGSMVWDKAKVNPKTAQGMLDLQRTIDGIYKKFADVGAIIIEAALPAMQAAADAASWLVDQLVEVIEWLDQFGVVAALQTGDFSKAFEIAWKQIQLLFTQGSQYVTAAFDTMTSGILAAWDQMAIKLGEILGDALRKVGDTLVGFSIAAKVYFPQIGEQLGPLKELGRSLSQAGKGLEIGSGLAKTGADNEAESRAKMAEEKQRILQAEIDALKAEIATSTESAVAKRDRQRKDREAGIDQTLAARASVAGSGGIRGTFALQASGGNPVWQTQKDILREIKEQKALQQEQVRLMRDQKGNQVRFAQ